MSMGQALKHRPVEDIPFADDIPLANGVRAEIANIMASTITDEVDLGDESAVIKYLIDMRFHAKDVNDCVEEAIEKARVLRARATAQA